MKKTLSVLLAVLMIVAMMPTVFAASSAPVITTSVDTTDIKVGDIVTVTVKISADSKICALEYNLEYNSSDFEYVSHTLGDVFFAEAKNKEITAGKYSFKYSAATDKCHTGAEAVLFKAQLKAKTTNGKLTAKITEAYTSTGGEDYTNVLPAVVLTSNTIITFGTNDYMSIATPSTSTIRYKDGIVLHANIKSTRPKDSYIEWTTDNNNFTTSVSEDKESFTIISKSNGTTKITATLYSASGRFLDADTIEIKSKAGFFDKIAVFFSTLFGKDPVIKPN